MGGGVGPTASPDVLEKRQTSTVPRFEPRTVQSLAVAIPSKQSDSIQNTYKCVLLIILI